MAPDVAGEVGVALDEKEVEQVREAKAILDGADDELLEEFLTDLLEHSYSRLRVQNA